MAKPGLRVGLFGKVSSHPDFVRFNAGGLLARAFDQWIAEGLVELRQRAGADWESVFDLARPLAFVFRQGSGREALVGWCGPGRDAGGRRYPVTLFAEATLDRGGNTFAHLPTAFSGFLAAAAVQGQRARLEGIDDTESARIPLLANLLPEKPVEVEREFDEYLSDVTMGSFWRGVFGDFNDRRKYLVIKNIFGALAPLRGLEPGRARAVLRLPVSGGHEDAARQIGVWILMARAILGAKGLSEATVFWDHEPGEAGGTGHLIFQPLRPQHWIPLVARDLAVDGLWDVAQIGAERIATVHEEIGPEVTQALDSPDLRIQDFIARV